MNKSRKTFLMGGGTLLLAGCAGAIESSSVSRSLQSKVASPDLCILGQPNCGHGTPLPYKYSATQSTSNGATGTAQYNSATYLLTSGSYNGSAVFNGNISSTINSDGSITSQHIANPSFSGAPSQISVVKTLPSSIPSNGSYTYTDSYGLVHTTTVATSGSAISITDVFTTAGNTWSFSVTSPDGNAITVTYNTAAGSGSFSFTLPALACSVHPARQVAFFDSGARGVDTDVPRIRDGAEVAIALCCTCIQRQADLGAGISAVSGGLAVLAGMSGIGLPAVPFLTAYSAVTGIYSGVMTITHAVACRG